MALTDKLWLTEAMRKMVSENLITRLPAAPLRGIDISSVWLDEIGDLPKLSTVKASFQNPNWPAADVTVEEQVLDGQNPRHPNPKAGSIKQYVVIASGRRSKPEGDLTVARINAEQLHNRLVAALEKDRDQEYVGVPNWGAF